MSLVCDKCGEPIVDAKSATLEWDMTGKADHNMRVVHMSECANEYAERDAPLGLYIGSTGEKVLRLKIKEQNFSNDEVERMIARLKGVL